MPADIKGARSRSHGGADSARTRRAGVCALLDWHSLPGRGTRVLREERGVGQGVETTEHRSGRAADQDVPLREFQPYVPLRHWVYL